MGAWIFTHQRLAWLYQRPNRDQLPWAYRRFAAYCESRQANEQGTVPGAGHMFDLVSGIHRSLRRPYECRIDLGRYVAYLNLHDPRMLQVPNELLSEQADTAFLQNYLSPGDSFIDAGANHGSFSIVASKLIGNSGMIAAIEPQPHLATLVEKALKDNFDGRFTVYNIACSDSEGVAEFFVPRGSSGSAGLIPGFSGNADHQHFEVQVKRFDDAVAWRKLPGNLFLKLDVEGSELSLLQGASDMLRTRQPTIMMEINPVSMKEAGVACSNLADLLKNAGYRHFVELRGDHKRHPIESLSTNRHRNVIILSDKGQGTRDST